MGATKAKRPAKRRNLPADKSSDEDWSSSESNFTPVQRTRNNRVAPIRNKKVSEDKVLKSRQTVKRPAKASLKYSDKAAAGDTSDLNTAALNNHDAGSGNEFNSSASSFSYPRRTMNGNELTRLADALDLQYRGAPVENFGEYVPEDFESDSSSVGGEPMMANTGRVSRPKKPKGATPNTNGRVVGRKLVKWHRPRMAEKLLLHAQYECHRRHISLPWDKIVKRLSPGSSGFSALQHMNKLRDILVTEGHMVPPLLGKKHVAQDPSIRGFIRDMDGELPNSTRVVRWGEHIEDRKHNLVVPGLVRGSGTYPRKAVGRTMTLETATKFQGQRRDRRPAELREVSKAPLMRTPRRGRPGPKPGSRNRQSNEVQVLAADHTVLERSTVKGGYGLRKTEPKSFKESENFQDEADADVDMEYDSPEDTDVAESGPRDIDFYERLTPPPTMPVTLHLPPHALSKFPRGQSSYSNGPSLDRYNSDSFRNESSPGVAEPAEPRSEKRSYEEYQSICRDDQSSQQCAAGQANPNFFNPSLSVFTTLETGFIRGNTSQKLSSDTPLDKASVARHKSVEINQFEAVAKYQGRDEHGTMAEYLTALRHGEDPRINGQCKRRPQTGTLAEPMEDRKENLHLRHTTNSCVHEQTDTVNLMEIEAGGTWQADHQNVDIVPAATPKVIQSSDDTTIIQNPDGTVEMYKTWQSEEDFQQPSSHIADSNHPQLEASALLSGSFDQLSSSSSESETRSTDVYSSFGTQSTTSALSFGSFHEVEGTNLFPYQAYHQQIVPGPQQQIVHGFDQNLQGLRGNVFTHDNQIMQSVEIDEVHAAAALNHLSSIHFELAPLETQVHTDQGWQYGQDDFLHDNGHGNDDMVRYVQY